MVSDSLGGAVVESTACGVTCCGWRRVASASWRAGGSYDAAAACGRHGSGFDVKVGCADFFRKKSTAVGVWELAHYLAPTDFIPPRFLNEYIRWFSGRIGAETDERPAGGGNSWLRRPQPQVRREFCIPLLGT